MIDLSVGALLYSDIVDPGDHEIYVVRDGELVLYVGQSDQVLVRLDQHVWYRTSALGRVILDNTPDSLAWTVELWRVSECNRKLEDHLPGRQPVDKNLAERRMILARRPCLNVIHNPYHRLIPRQYRSPELAAQIREAMIGPSEPESVRDVPQEPGVLPENTSPPQRMSLADLRRIVVTSEEIREAMQSFRRRNEGSGEI